MVIIFGKHILNSDLCDYISINNHTHGPVEVKILLSLGGGCLMNNHATSPIFIYAVLVIMIMILTKHDEKHSADNRFWYGNKQSSNLPRQLSMIIILTKHYKETSADNRFWYGDKQSPNLRRHSKYDYNTYQTWGETFRRQQVLVWWQTVSKFTQTTKYDHNTYQTWQGTFRRQQVLVW